MNELTNFWERNRLFIKGALIALLVLLLLIPTAFIASLVGERQSRQEEARKEVSSHWASAQTVTGPVLIIPYWKPSPDKSTEGSKELAYFLPEHLTIEGNITPEKRYRGIYEVMLYRSGITIQGNFAPLNLSELKLTSDQMFWKEASLVMGISDLRGLDEQVKLKWNDTAFSFDPGVLSNDLIGSGMQLSLPQNALTATPATGGMYFSMRLVLKGSERLDFIPVGKTTEVSLQSPWNTPSFSGSFLPATRQVTADGFKAGWKVFNLNRNFPQSWTESHYKVKESAFGVDLLLPVDMYQKTMRCVKYAILLIGFTFLAFFLIETIRGGRVHPFQYVLIGFALCIFYVLLLSISEFLRFSAAYIIAALSTAGLIMVYTLGLFRKKLFSILVGAILLFLYGFVFILVQLEDLALLIGSIGLFLILALVMYFSRKIDWYGMTSPDPLKQ